MNNNTGDRDLRIGGRHATANTILNVTVIAGSIFFSLALIECILPYLRIQGVERHVFLHRMPIVQYLYGKYHPVLGNTLKPNIDHAHIQYENYMDYSFRTNKDGFRGSDWDLSNNRKNIVLLGDSYAFGWGVEENEMFSTLLERELHRVDPSFQIVNLAQSGYFLDQVVNAFELFGRKFNPVLIVYLYCYNDPIQHPLLESGKFDLSSFRTNVTQADWLADARRNNVDAWRFERFWKESYVYAFYKNYIGPIFYTESNSPYRAWKEKYVFTYEGLLLPDPPATPIPRDTVNQQYIWYCLTKLFDDSNHTTLILMDVSDKMTLHQKDRKDSDRWILRDFAHQHENVFFVDFESELRLKNDGVPRFLTVDDHWNSEGHLLASEMVGAVIKSNWDTFQIKKRSGN